MEEITMGETLEHALEAGTVYNGKDYVVDEDLLEQPETADHKIYSLDFMLDVLGYDAYQSMMGSKYHNYDDATNDFVEMIEPTPVNDETTLLDADILANIAKRQRNAIVALYNELNVNHDNPDDDGLRLVSLYEVELGIGDDPLVSDYLDRINSTIIYHRDFKRYTKRETVVSYLNANFVWGLTSIDPDLAIRTVSDNLKLECKYRGLTVADMLPVGDVWGGYKDYCTANGFKPRQTATHTEFNSYVEVHCGRYRTNDWNKQTRLGHGHDTTADLMFRDDKQLKVARDTKRWLNSCIKNKI